MAIALQQSSLRADHQAIWNLLNRNLSAGICIQMLAVIARTTMAINISSENYETYKKVFSIISRQIFKDLDAVMPAEHNPIAVLESWEATSKSIAKKGLQSGLNDTLSSLKHYPKAILIEINNDLEKENLPNLNILLGTIEKTLKKILKKKKINTIDEFYIIKEIVVDTSSEISIADREILNECIGEYEARGTNRSHQI